MTGWVGRHADGLEDRKFVVWFNFLFIGVLVVTVGSGGKGRVLIDLTLSYKQNVSYYARGNANPQNDIK